MKLLERAYGDAPVSAEPASHLGPSEQNEDRDLLVRGFRLAHFIFPDRPTALRILIGALNKLNSRASQERKRLYWRDKFLKNRITRITRDDPDTLQWLIYLESDSHEEAQEDGGRATQGDMVVRFIKTIVRLSAGLSSFYVNVAVHRLLFCYTTAETQSIYEFVTDHYREADEYRRAKRLLMTRLESRFGDRLRTIKGDRGETRYELADNQGTWRDLVMNSLQMFTPWSTMEKCLCRRQSIACASRFHKEINAFYEEKSSQDSIEISRCHVFIDPACCGSVVQELGLEPHSSKLGVPRFDMASERNQRPPSHRFPDAPLTSQERQAIANTLSAEEARRKKVIAHELRFVVDGTDYGRLDFEGSREACFNAPAESRLLEIWTDDEQGPLLLATHIMPRPEIFSDTKAVFTLTLRSRGRLSVSAVREFQDETGSWNISTAVDKNDGLAGRSSVRDWLMWTPPIPAYAGMLVLFVVLIFVWAGFEWKLTNEQVAKSAVRTEVARQPTAGILTNRAQQLSAALVYRLTPDDLITRSISTAPESTVLVPSTPTVINLQLPVYTRHDEFRAVLTSLKSQERIVTEDGLTPRANDAGEAVTFSVPSDLLSPGKYYRISLQNSVLRDVQTFTFYTTGSK